MIERRNGTFRGKNVSDNLLDSPFQIDQRSFWDIMGYLSAFLEKINYYNPENEPDGHWKELITGDPVIYMALIINEPLADLNLLVQNYEGTGTGDHDAPAVINLLLHWYRKIDEWYQTLMDLGEKKLAYKIKNTLVDVLTYQKENLLLYQQKLRQDRETESVPAGSSPDVKLMIPPPPKPGSDVDLGKILITFQKSIIHIQRVTKSYLEKNMLADNGHMPNNAMYIAFAVLFKTLQEKLNTLSGRHLDFYYKDILQQQYKAGFPVRAIVNFELLPAIASSFIDKGARLSAGKLFGSKTDVLFQTEKPLVVYPIELVEMQSLLLNSNPNIKIGTDEPLISSLSKNILIAQGKAVNSRENWFVFGAGRPSIQNPHMDAGKETMLGFIITSPVLMLSEGKREIDIVLRLASNSSKNTFWKLLNQIKSNRKIAMDMAFSEVFDQSLKISFTHKNGWSDFDNYAITYDESGNEVTIRLVLEITDPSLERSTRIQENLSWPAIKVVLNEHAPVYAYSFLKGVEVDSIDIEVNVQRIKNLSLYNQIGKMPLGKPFDLFGPVPAVGSYLMVGKSELFKKQIDQLEIDLEWASVPSDAGGFETYYNGYTENINNDAFKIQFTALSAGNWLPADLDHAPVFDLFSTTSVLSPEGYQSVLLDHSRSIKTNQFKGFGISSSQFSLKDPLKYDITAQSGFVKLTLVAPNYGFGADLYQKEFTDIATYNAHHKDQLPYPNKPFVPKVKAISVNYKASGTLVFNKRFSKKRTEENTGEFIHLSPFGMEKVVVNQDVKKHTLLPDFKAEGYFLMGLKGVKTSTTISIYFHFLQSGDTVDIDKHELTWEYCQQHKWFKFSKEDIMLDGTNGFAKSGIVELTLPKAGVRETTVNQEIYWIRVSTGKNAIQYPQIKGIYLNAVEAKCITTDDKVIGKEVPAGSISRLAVKYSDIKKVNQPTVSFGGALPESTNRFYTRISERLRHKSRAVTLWDYERLILENFPDVGAVKCTNFDKSFKAVPGKATVIVVNEKWTHDEESYFGADVLDEMKAFLKKRSGPFVDIQVINPLVEYLLTDCIVRFMPQDSGGFYIHRLNKAIANYLSRHSDVNIGIGGIGGSVLPTMVMSFVENLPYIETIEKLTIEHIIRSNANQYSLGVYQDDQEIKATTPWSVLMPANQQHIINSLDENQPHEEDMQVGIGSMEIGLDLILEDRPAFKPQPEPETEQKTETVADNFVVVEKTDLPNDTVLAFKHKPQKK